MERPRANLGGHGPINGAAIARFRFPIRCFILKPECLKEIWGQKSRPKHFGLFDHL